MPQSSPLTFADATSWLTLTEPPPESADRSADLFSQFVERARRQDAFYDDVALTPAQFRQTSTYLACRGELFLLCHRLMSLLPATGPDADTVVAQALGQQAAGWSRLATGIDDQQAQMFGCGKHLMLALCEALENDRRPETQALAARHLRAAFHGEALHPGAVTAIGDALSQVLAASRPDEAGRRRQLASSALTEWARVRNFPHWRPAEVAAAFLEYLGVDEEPDVTPDTAFNPAATGAPTINAAYAACAKAWAADRL